jgi:hypothetical protein
MSLHYWDPKPFHPVIPNSFYMAQLIESYRPIYPPIYCDLYNVFLSELIPPVSEDKTRSTAIS